MGTTSHKVRAAEARRVKHPVYPKIEKHYLTVRAIDLPDGIRKDANARDGEGKDLRKQVYREVQRSLVEEQGYPGIFNLKNKGIVIIAESVSKVGENIYEIRVRDGQGIVDGGHTYDIITDAQKGENIPDDQYVDVQVCTGVSDEMITEISSGLNTGIAVKHHSIANLDGKYDWIKEEVKGEPYAGRIAWRESDAGDYDVRDLICVMEAMNVVDFPNDSGLHPISSYEGRERVTKKFSEDADSAKTGKKEPKYRKMQPILKGALVLYDTIRHDFRKVYNDQNFGKAGRLDIVERARGGRKYEFPFAGLPDEERRLTKGALYPIFAAFRNKVRINPETGQAEWDGGFQSVINLWKKAAPELVQQTRAATKDYGHKPYVLGKSRGHWNNVHKTVEVHMLRALHRS